MQRLWFVAIRYTNGGLTRLTIRSEVAKTYDGALAKVLNNPDFKDIVAYQRLHKIHRGNGPKSYKYTWIELNEQN